MKADGLVRTQGNKPSLSTTSCHLRNSPLGYLEQKQFISILQMRSVRLKEDEIPVQGHTVSICSGVGWLLCRVT